MLLEIFLILFSLLLLIKIQNYININTRQNNIIVTGHPVEIALGRPLYNRNDMIVEIQRS